MSRAREPKLLRMWELKKQVHLRPFPFFGGGDDGSWWSSFLKKKTRRGTGLMYICILLELMESVSSSSLLQFSNLILNIF